MNNERHAGAGQSAFPLTELDLRNADLNGTDLRDAVLRGADLQGADLSTAHLNGPELRGAILHRGVFFGDKGQIYVLKPYETPLSH